MQAKSEKLRAIRRTAGTRAPGKNRPAARSRLPYAERKAQILETAAEFFADYGLTAQTRNLAEKCGISQRLLYRFFPTKEDLLAEVYKANIVGPFKAAWFAELRNRSHPMEARLTLFYKDYLRTVLTRKWLRLFMYASLAEVSMAPDYISSIITQLLETIMTEMAEEFGLDLPRDKAALHEMGWTLHGAISHYAIRRHLYGASHILPEDKVIALQIRMFMAGFESMVREYSDHLA